MVIIAGVVMSLILRRQIDELEERLHDMLDSTIGCPGENPFACDHIVGECERYDVSFYLMINAAFANKVLDYMEDARGDGEHWCFDLADYERKLESEVLSILHRKDIELKLENGIDGRKLVRPYKFERC